MPTVANLNASPLRAADGFHYSGDMETAAAITLMSALAQPTRLAVFVLLARAGAEGMTAGALAERTGTPANTMSSHLLILSRAGLADSRRVGRNIFYAAKAEAVVELSAFLAEVSAAK